MHRESHLHNPPDPDPIRLADYSRSADLSTQLINVMPPAPRESNR
jgi:hypothetical protein